MLRLALLPFVLCLAVAMPLAAGEKATPEEAQALLTKAVEAIKTQGEEKALAQFNDPKGGYQDRELYVFCSGPDNKMTAHPDPKMIGVDTTTLKDPDGREIGKEIAAIRSKGEGVVEYRWMNPVSGKVEPKTSYVKLAADQLCGVGAYK